MGGGGGGGGVKYQGRDDAEARGIDGQLLSDRQPSIRCEKTYSAW